MLPSSMSYDYPGGGKDPYGVGLTGRSALSVGLVGNHSKPTLSYYD